MGTLRNARALIHHGTSVIVVTSCLEEAKIMTSQLARIMPAAQRTSAVRLTFPNQTTATFRSITEGCEGLRSARAMVIFGPDPLLHVSHREALDWMQAAGWANLRLRNYGVDPNKPVT